MEGVGMAIFLKDIFTLRNLCYYASQKTIWIHERNLCGFELGREVPKPFFDCGAKAAA